VIAEEYGDWIDANRRIDLLCIDEKARLVIVELKRDSSGHMELQALRYAAMILTMRFKKAVEAHGKYLKRMGSEADPERASREFLDMEECPVELSETVRIVLASSDFSTEVTTTVLWLNKMGLDIRCVRMAPHEVDGRGLIDVQQVIPLKAAEQYQVALREKALEQAAARTQARDMTRYDLTVDETSLTNLPKRRLIYEIVAEAIRRGLSPLVVAAAVPWRETSMFVSVEGALSEAGLLAGYSNPLDRYYTSDGDLFHSAGRTYALSRIWGDRTLEAIKNIMAEMPPGPAVEYAPTTAVVGEVTYGAFTIRRRESGTIQIERGGESCQPAKPALRDMALGLGLPLYNGRSTELNTRQLGASVIKAVSEL